MLDTGVGQRKLDQYHRHRSFPSRMGHAGHLSLGIIESVMLFGHELDAAVDGDAPDHNVQELFGGKLIGVVCHLGGD